MFILVLFIVANAQNILCLLNNKTILKIFQVQFPKKIHSN